ncbi:MAG: hypothetical protein IJC91_00050, partial [Oscillospiraceae bacterium]|nr:hypothetical protein [Oscillospiraceae bacterium]
MASVTQRIKEIQQPHGGYLPIKLFSKTVLSDGKTLNEVENIHSSLVGLAVDYLTRFMMGTPAIQAFNISLMGATNIKKDDIALYLIENIRGLDDASINCACKLVGFDVCYRSSATGYKPVENIVPDTPTIENIRTMVKRSMVFFGQY